MPATPSRWRRWTSWRRRSTARPAPRALVITGAGDKAFVSGGDLKELSALRTEAEAAAMAWRMRTVCDRIADFPGPVIAALNGHALGGGAEVAVAADIRLAADDIKIGFNQVALAIMPAWGGAERLADAGRTGQALLLAGTGAVLDAAEAERVGLVDRWCRGRRSRTGGAPGAELAHRPAGEIKRVMTGVSTTRPSRRSPAVGGRRALGRPRTR